MIEVTRLNGNSMRINSDLIKIVEASPDTMLTLIHGEKLIVRESCEEIDARILDWRARLLAAMTRKLHSEQAVLQMAGLSSLDPETGTPGAVQTEKA